MRLQNGQTLLIVILVMVVSLTVGLAVVSRSITNLRTTTEEENSQRAFSAAEAGVEQALRLSAIGQGVITNKQLGNSASIQNVDIAEVSGTQFLVQGGNSIVKDNGVDLWLSDYNDSPSLRYKNQKTLTLTLYWGSSTDTCSSSSNTMAALEVIVLSGTPTSPSSTRYIFDPCDDRRNQNSFDDIDRSPTGPYAVLGRSFRYKTTAISVANGLFARLIPLYASSVIAVKGCAHGIPADSPSCVSLPVQGKQIQAIGTSGTTSRKVTYYQGFPELPSELFSTILFSPK